MNWARIKFNTNFVIKKGQVIEKYRFTVVETNLKYLSEKAIKILGKTFVSSLKDTAPDTIFKNLNDV